MKSGNRDYSLSTSIRKDFISRYGRLFETILAKIANSDWFIDERDTSCFLE
jgi:hypothetical protein